MLNSCEKLKVMNGQYPDQLGKVEEESFLEYMELSSADQISPSSRPTMRGRQTFSRTETLNWSRRGQSEPSPGVIRVEMQPNFNELFDWMNDEDDDDTTHSQLFTSIRHSLGSAEERIRTYTKDYFLYNLTLTGAYFAFALLFGIILAYIIHSNLYSHHENFQSYYDKNATGTKNLTRFQKQQDFANFLQYQVNLKYSQYQFDWETSSKCRIKNEEYLEKIHMMEEEISDLRQQFSEKLTLKQETINKLLKAVIKHKDGHFFIQKSSVYQFFMYLVCFGWAGTSGYVVYRYFY